jgi:hypothetical protein
LILPRRATVSEARRVVAALPVEEIGLRIVSGASLV